MKALTIKREHKGSAWRAIYVSWQGRQIAHMGVDPTADGGPRLFGGIGYGGRRFRLPLPHIPWGWVDRWPILLPLYKFSNYFWHQLDGRHK